MQIVMVKFAVDTNHVRASVNALKDITGTLVAAPQQFHGATVQVTNCWAPFSRQGRK